MWLLMSLSSSLLRAPCFLFSLLLQNAFVEREMYENSTLVRLCVCVCTPPTHVWFHVSAPPGKKGWG